MCLPLTNAFIILPLSHLLDLRFTLPPCKPLEEKKQERKKHRQKCNKSREAITVFSPCLWKWWVSQCSRGSKPLPGDPSCRRKAEPAPCTCCNVFCFRMLSLDTARYTGSVALCRNTVWIYSMILQSHIQTLTIFFAINYIFFVYAFLDCKNSSPCMTPLSLP